MEQRSILHKYGASTMWRRTVAALFIALLSACTHAPQKAVEEPAAAPTSPDNGQQQFAHAIDVLKRGHQQEALILFRGLAEKYPELAAPFVNIGLLELQMNNFNEAETAFLQAAKLKPGLAEAYNGLGIVYRQTGRFKDAETAYLKALRCFPDYASAHLNLGILYDIYLDNPGGALEHYERYQTLKGGNSDLVAKWIAAMKQQQAKNTESQR